MKYALIAGVNLYRNSPLRGCANDSVEEHAIIASKLGFKEIAILKDERATTARIKKLLTSVKSLVVPGDLFYFCYSGHGAQIPDKTEADGLSEVLCPVDFDWTLEHMITDDFLADILDGFKGLFVGSFDSCHSGTAIERDFDIIPKRFPRLESLPISATTVRTIVHADSTKKGILMAGCHDKETSADAMIHGQYRGAFTFCKNKALAEYNYRVSYSDLMKRTAQILKQLGFDQNPELDCPSPYLNELYLQQG